MLFKQKQKTLSPYAGLYDIVVPKDHKLRKLKDLVDFSFVYDELKDKYSHDNGRGATCPVVMFKFLILKAMYDLSDVDLVQRTLSDMAFKFFLDMNPEDEVICSSSLTKFRRTRLKDTELLDMLLKKTTEIAYEKGVIKSNALIVDSTHTSSKYRMKTPISALKELSKGLRRTVYNFDETFKEKMPKKNQEEILSKEIDYSKHLIEIVENLPKIQLSSEVTSKLNLLKEFLDDIENDITLSKDKEAKVGHKDADTSFLGYKSHLAMTEERIVVSATVTTGEKPDGKELKKLVNKAREAGVQVESVIGDAAYSEKNNIEFCREEGIDLVSRLSKTVTHGNERSSGEFEFNKDADRYVCKQGHMSIKKSVNGKKRREAEGSQMVETYFFDVEKCKVCPQKEGCYKEGARTKSYSVTIKSHTHQAHEDYQNTEEFKEKAKVRYMIEAKNSELKSSHGYDKTKYSGLFGMEMQSAVTLFTVNLKRIMTLLEG